MEKLILKIKKVLMEPKTVWSEIQTENETVSSLLKSYILPLAAIPAIASLIGYWLIGINVPPWGRMASFEWGLNQAISSYIAIVAGILLTSWVISWLAPKFGTTVTLDNAVKLVTYSYFPIFIGGIFYLIPSLAIIASLAGIYGLYILYQGFTPITGVSDKKRTSYYVVSLITMIVLFFVLGLIIASILGALGLSQMKYQ